MRLVRSTRSCVRSGVTARGHHIGRLAAQARAAQAASKAARQPARHRAPALHVDDQAPPFQLLGVCCPESGFGVASGVELDERVAARLVGDGVVHDAQSLDWPVRLKLAPQLRL
jgi:hypothetical protein